MIKKLSSKILNFKLTSKKYLFLLFILSFISLIQIVILPNIFNLYIKRFIFERNLFLIEQINELKIKSCNKFYSQRTFVIEEGSLISIMCQKND